MTANPAILFSEISDYIEQSKALLSSGQFVELAGLDARVAKLCESVVALTDGDRDRYADQLAQLAFNLDSLASAMKAHKDVIAAEINKTADTRKASIAYKTADSRDAFGEKKEE